MKFLFLIVFLLAAATPIRGEQVVLPPPLPMLGYAELIGKLEGSLLKELLWRFDGKPTRVAAALGMNRTTLRKKCAELLDQE